MTAQSMKYAGAFGLSSTYQLSDFSVEDVTNNLEQITTALYDGDRRMDHRLKMEGCRILTRPVNESTQEWTETVPVNFSRGGAQFLSTQRYAQGDHLWLHISTDQAITALEPFVVGAEVRHVSRDGEKYRTGVQFRLQMIKDMTRVNAEHAISRLEGFLIALASTTTAQKDR